ncbi:porin family protein [Flagellimonas meridianipacifica]|uniref:Outer membrane protein with beta-barrel domain n=1 Tax=Flagellimonas meridianipacifica TaxID=1080225 RepID=A0A2T0MJ97_9FLAO|nr:porin family protein [Allomuricauda pacifica]PRX57654.1 outer membrane protein with beta-barrel domain [Allomuricauda pacifica]
MKYNLWVLLFILCQFAGNSQQENSSEISRYFEDQFYIGTGINFLTERPTGVVQNSLSYNLQLGFIKDIPINKARNFGLGLGLGYATNSYFSNIRADNSGGEIAYSILDSDDFRRNKLETHAIEMPLEIRWRTSTATEYKFWRIYGGLRFAYIFAGSSKLVLETENSLNITDDTIRFSNSDIRDFQYGLTLSFGYNTFNIHSYYSLNPLLNDGVVLDNGESIDTRVFRIGIIFYIL